MLTVAVCNTKGGVAKTTTSIHLASALSRQGRTVLIDTDPQASSWRWSDLAAGEMPFTTHVHPAPLLRETFDRFKGDAEYAVIDTPPGHEDIIRAAVALADTVIVPVEPLMMDLDRLSPTIALLTDVQNDPDVVVLLTRVRLGTLSARSARSLLTARGLPVLNTEIPLREAIGWSYGTVPEPGVYDTVLAELLTPPLATTA